MKILNRWTDAILWEGEAERDQLRYRLFQRLHLASSGCLLWRGAVSEDGYGRIKVRGRLQGTHRVALALALDNPRLPQFQALHSCDTPACCLDAHLSWGTNSANMLDRSAKGRTQPNPLRGAQNPNAKLTREKVDAIRLLLRQGTVSRRQLAHQFNVSDRTIRNIEQGKKWRQAA